MNCWFNFICLPVRPVSALPAFDQPALRREPGQNPVSRGRRDATKLPYMGILNYIVTFQELLDLPPSLHSFIFQGIAHFITHRCGFYE